MTGSKSLSDELNLSKLALYSASVLYFVITQEEAGSSLSSTSETTHIPHGLIKDHDVAMNILYKSTVPFIIKMNKDEVYRMIGTWYRLAKVSRS